MTTNAVTFAVHYRTCITGYLSIKHIKPIESGVIRYGLP